MRSPLVSSLVALGAALALAPATAQDGSGLRYQLSGFANFTVAKVLSGSNQSYMQWTCPCAIQNWEYVGVYEKSKGWQADQESLVGVQGTVHLSDSVSATAQVLSRPNNFNYRPTIDWAYASWSVSDHWTLQAGRKRIPLYYYSDFLYIGTAYPWVRPPADVYGWPIYAYDGVNAAYTGQWGGITVDANLWAGRFDRRDAPYDTKIYYGTPTNEKWESIAGGYLTLTQGEWSTRLMLMRFKDTIWQTQAGAPDKIITPGYSTVIGGLSANYDGSHWLLRTELNRFKQSVSKFQYDYYLAGLGYKWGELTGIGTVSRYVTRDLGAGFEGRLSYSLAVRYDLNKNWALKAQYDWSKDKTTAYTFFGDHRMLSFSAQTSF
ncbi:MAG: hypothetical protein EKK52_18135 [Burkholderiales bacterium]|uniref:hypothetical protein n=1 Tax=Roseateles sp. TaxID=1971397 RepID=UPI000FB6EA40|nr:MAG: hypothetical protein EKK52_18135 [Burkholderiales bacterium]